MASTSGANAELGRRVCLALADEGVEHGWAMVKLLAPGAELGRIWSLSRPLTYRAIASLVDDALVERVGTVAGRGPDRQALRVTDAGTRSNRHWLGQPVEHVRDVRTELVMKLVLRKRRGWGVGALVALQLERFEPVFAAMRTPDDHDLIGRWRREQVLAGERFLRGLIDVP